MNFNKNPAQFCKLYISKIFKKQCKKILSNIEYFKTMLDYVSSENKFSWNSLFENSGSFKVSKKYYNSWGIMNTGNSEVCLNGSNSIELTNYLNSVCKLDLISEFFCKNLFTFSYNHVEAISILIYPSIIKILSENYMQCIKNIDKIEFDEDDIKNIINNYINTHFLNPQYIKTYYKSTEYSNRINPNYNMNVKDIYGSWDSSKREFQKYDINEYISNIMNDKSLLNALQTSIENLISTIATQNFIYDIYWKYINAHFIDKYSNKINLYSLNDGYSGFYSFTNNETKSMYFYDFTFFMNEYKERSKLYTKRNLDNVNLHKIFDEFSPIVRHGDILKSFVKNKFNLKSDYITYWR